MQRAVESTLPSDLSTWQGEALWQGPASNDRTVYVAPLGEADFIAEGVLLDSSQVVFVLRVLGRDLDRFTRKMEHQKARVVRCLQLPFDGGTVDGSTSQPKGAPPLRPGPLLTTRQEATSPASAPASPRRATGHGKRRPLAGSKPRRTASKPRRATSRR